MLLMIADIPRTFPDNIYFQDTPGDPQAKRGPLYNVLVALGTKNPSVGYCQVCICSGHIIIKQTLGTDECKKVTSKHDANK